MKFKVAPVDENFPSLRMVSELGFWEIGYVPVLFGYRVRFGRTGQSYVACDLCCGDDISLRSKVLGYILAVLYSADEQAMTEQMARMLFPNPTVRPLNKCPIWQEKLKLFEHLNPEQIETVMQNPLKVFFLSVGQQYRREVHPNGLHPDSWVEIIAKDYEQAREAAFAHFGKQWCWLYESKNFNPTFFPAGCSHRIDATITQSETHEKQRA